MRAPWCLPFTLGLALAAPTALPWSEGYLDLGQTAAFPLVLRPRSPTPMPDAPSPPRTVGARVLWSAKPLPPVRAVLTPGRPTPLGQGWQAPVALTLNATAPAVVEVLNQPMAVHPGLTVPAVRLGQAFLRVDLDAVYRQAGRVLSVPELAGRVLTLKRLDAGAATFMMDGLGEVQRDGDPKGGFPDLAPLIDDPELAALKRKYEGQPVWGYGGLHADCFPSAREQVGMEVPLTQGVRVRQVARLGKPMLLNVQGGVGSGEVGWGADALALTPLVFLLDPAPFESAGTVSFSSSGGNEPPQSTGVPSSAPEDFMAQIEQATRPGVCGQSVAIYLLDTWAVTRVLSRTAPGAGVPGVGDGRGPGISAPIPARGLTRWQYAWLSGFPSSTFGDLSAVLRLSKWEYRNIPFPATVTFDAQGKVSEVDVPRLP
ncbi:hypothetical protein [Deinococcus marmoris]|uniref:hypothetical protein n=1 Tax=Deinococcus marmoris TaxID=249408 RepID=UPI0004970296|nr:hypothetical protein [Deinococcus marmoris]